MSWYQKIWEKNGRPYADKNNKLYRAFTYLVQHYDSQTTTPRAYYVQWVNPYSGVVEIYDVDDANETLTLVCMDNAENFLGAIPPQSTPAQKSTPLVNPNINC